MVDYIIYSQLNCYGHVPRIIEEFWAADCLEEEESEDPEIHGWKKRQLEWINKEEWRSKLKLYAKKETSIICT